MEAFLNTVLAIIMSFLAVVYPVKPENVTVTVRPVTTKSAGITFECENNTRRSIDRPNVCSIEKKDENGSWQDVGISYGYTDESYSIYHGRSAVDSIEISDPFTEFKGLEKGEYRLTVRYIILDGTGTVAYASGEFTVTDPA